MNRKPYSNHILTYSMNRKPYSNHILTYSMTRKPYSNPGLSNSVPGELQSCSLFCSNSDLVTTGVRAKTYRRVFFRKQGWRAMRLTIL